MRLFVAVYPPPEVRAHFGELVGRLAVARPMPPGQSTRLATPDRWHVTLAFIGDVGDEQAGDAVDALRDLPIGPPTVRVAGGGRFGRGKFTTLYASVRDAATPSDPGKQEPTGVAGLGDATRKALRRRRVPHDRRPLQPHITIARPGTRIPAEDLAADLAALHGYEGPLWTMDEVRLVRSFLGPNPEYEPITTVALAR